MVFAPVRSALRVMRRRVLPQGLSARLLLLTILFVLISEILIYVPSLDNQRRELLRDRLEAAQIAALALEAADGEMVGEELTEELLANAGVISVTLKRNEERSLFLMPGPIPPAPAERFDLVSESRLKSLGDAIALLLRREERVISVRDVPRLEGGLLIEVLMSERPIRDALITYSRNILALSLLIGVISASLVYGAIHLLLVRPMQKLQRSMTSFRQNPEDVKSIMYPSERRDEVGTAERELATMQRDLRQALTQRARLAALGTAVSKINHDLRNMLASAQLVADRLEISEDPLVKRLAPKLVSAIDRAVKLCTNTLAYGRAEEAPPDRRPFALAAVARDAVSSAVPEGSEKVRWSCEIDTSLEIVADPDHLFRALLNLARNAAQAIDAMGRQGEIVISARPEGDGILIAVRDTGPGIPERALERLFEPFSTSQRPGGTGLGLAIARELVKGHGGDLRLASTGPQGTEFEIALPDSLKP